MDSDESRLDALADRLARGRPAFFLDYDGTLAAIAPRPELAILAPGMRQRVAGLAAHCPVAIVSGRDLDDVKGLVGIDGLIYAGSHGLDIEVRGERHGLADAFRPALERAVTALERALAPIPGALVQPKRYAITVHTRLVDPAAKPGVAAIVRDVLAGEGTLRYMAGKEMHELRPDMAWDKGAAVLHLMTSAEMVGRLPVYIGDDITDEDAFRVLSGKGVGLLVGDHGAATAADAVLPDIAAVGDLLDQVVARLTSDRRSPGSDASGR